MTPDILTAEQMALLGKIGSTPMFRERFYLTGGTPLAAFNLQHRYSEDLDFFSEREVDVGALNVFFKEIKDDLGFIDIDFQQSFNRNLFFLKFKNSVLKTEFTYFPFARIEKGAAQFGLDVDSLIDIAVNKLFTIYQRTQARDYIDLYVICRDRGLAISDLVKQARIKFDTHIDPIQLGTQFVKAAEATDYPRLIRIFNPSEWQSFFMAEAKKLKLEVIE